MGRRFVEVANFRVSPCIFYEFFCAKLYCSVLEKKINTTTNSTVQNDDIMLLPGGPELDSEHAY